MKVFFGAAVFSLIPIVVNAVYSCYSSSSSVAKRILRVYDDNNSSGVFWERVKLDSELVPCNVSSLDPSLSKCNVCLNNSFSTETALMVICNLTSRVELVLEGPNGHISFNQTKCPPTEPISVSKSSTTGPHNGRGRFGLFGSFAVFIAVFLWISYKCNKIRNTRPVAYGFRGKA